MTDIFISYSRQDFALVSQFAATLEELGYSVWWDVTGLHGGQAFAAEIQQAIKRASCVIVVWSEASVASNWVHSEATQADGQGNLLTAVYQDAHIPLPFNNRHNESLRNWTGDPDDPDFQKLLAAIGKSIGKYCPDTPSNLARSQPYQAAAVPAMPQEATPVNVGETVVLGSAMPWRAGVGIALAGVAAAYLLVPVFWGNIAPDPQPDVPLSPLPIAQSSPEPTPVPSPVVPTPRAVEPKPVRFSFEPKMVAISGGTFRMGCVDGRDEAHGVCDKNEKQDHVVRVPGFKMAATEITVGQFRAFSEATQYKTTAETEGSCWLDKMKKRPWPSVNSYSWRNPGFSQTDNHPVVCVTRRDVKAYLKWLNTKTGKTYRLPSEAEWEYAARGGDVTGAYPWGRDGKYGCGYANMADQTAKSRYGYLEGAAGCHDKYVHTAPVRKFNPNGFGLYDMHGNVAEWVEDVSHANYNSAPKNGSAWVNTSSLDPLRMIRGGSWHSTPWYARSAFRGRGIDKTHRYVTLGFRPVLNE